MSLFLFSLRTKSILVVIKQLMVAIDFHSMEKMLWKSMATVSGYVKVSKRWQKWHFWLNYLYKQSDCSHLNWSYSSSRVWSFVKSHQNFLHKTYYMSIIPWNWCLLTGTTKWSILVPALKDLISLPQSTTQCLSDWEFRVQVIACLILYIHKLVYVLE